MKVAVFGAGTMGSGIAQVFAAKGHTALMYASSTASAQRHKDKLAASLNKKVAKGKMTQEAADDIMSRILVEEFEGAADADLVIECVAENMAVKKELLGKPLSPELERIMAGRGLYCGEGVAVSEEDNGYRAAVAAPILCEGDVLGAVLFLSPDGKPAGETECKLAQTVASFLGKHMES